VTALVLKPLFVARCCGHAGHRQETGLKGQLQGPIQKAAIGQGGETGQAAGGVERICDFASIMTGSMGERWRKRNAGAV